MAARSNRQRTVNGIQHIGVDTLKPTIAFNRAHTEANTRLAGQQQHHHTLPTVLFQARPQDQLLPMHTMCSQMGLQPLPTFAPERPCGGPHERILHLAHPVQVLPFLQGSKWSTAAHGPQQQMAHTSKKCTMADN